MYIKALIGIFCGILSFTTVVFSCPMPIHNDSKSAIFVLDVYNKHAIEIKPGQTQVIDPTINDLSKHIRSEKLDFYVAEKLYPSNFYRKYQLIEKYCSDNSKDNTFSLSDVQKWVNHPTDRFSVKKFIPHAMSPHAQAGHKH